ncbi:MAG: hypothetical protein KTR21_15405 [Rhodobacteraceae bacterium]|nr:hypothetical protein [Paracoccaceae bacterium]
MVQSMPIRESANELRHLAALIAVEEWPRARPLAAKLLRQKPKSPEVLVLCAAVALCGADDPARAQRLLGAALDHRPGDPAALKLLNATQRRRGRLPA